MDTLWFFFPCKDPFKCDSGSFFADLDKGPVFEFVCVCLCAIIFFIILICLINSYLFIICVCPCGLILLMFFNLHAALYSVPYTECKLCRPSCEHNLNDVLEVLFSALIFCSYLFSQVSC